LRGAEPAKRIRASLSLIFP